MASCQVIVTNSLKRLRVWLYQATQLRHLLFNVVTTSATIEQVALWTNFVMPELSDLHRVVNLDLCL